MSRFRQKKGERKSVKERPRGLGPIRSRTAARKAWTKDRTIGVRAVQAYSGGIRYTEGDKTILMFVSAQAAMGIQRKRSEDALKASLVEKDILLKESDAEFRIRFRFREFNAG